MTTSRCSHRRWVAPPEDRLTAGGGTPPESRQGYAIDRADGIYHRRYAAHAHGLPRVRTVPELRSYIPFEGRLDACRECWPETVAPEPEPPKRAARRRRATPPAADDTGPKSPAASDEGTPAEGTEAATDEDGA